MKKCLIFCLIFAITLSANVWGVSTNFEKTNEYKGFADVTEGSWYEENLQIACEYGLIQGITEDKFSPNGNITVAEVLVLATRLNEIYYNGKTSLENGSPWYQTYVEYAIENEIIQENEFSNYNTNISRENFAKIIYNALPSEMYAEINTVIDNAIPDVSSENLYAKEIYSLYKSGILSGSDDFGTFLPKTNIKRSEVAVIISRIVENALRKTITLDYIGISEVILEEEIFLETGEVVSLDYKILPANGEIVQDEIKSSNELVVKINENNELVALSQGKSEITVTINGVKNNLSVFVDFTSAQSANLSANTLTVVVGETDKFSYSLSPSNAMGRNIVWSSSDTSVLHVSSNGEISALSNGTAVVTLYVDGAISSCIVTVEDYHVYNDYKNVPDFGKMNGKTAYKSEKTKYGYTYFYSFGETETSEEDAVILYIEALAKAGFESQNTYSEDGVYLFDMKKASTEITIIYTKGITSLVSVTIN